MQNTQTRVFSHHTARNYRISIARDPTLNLLLKFLNVRSNIQKDEMKFSSAIIDSGFMLIHRRLFPLERAADGEETRGGG
jgi:hypothetical protein